MTKRKLKPPSKAQQVPKGRQDYAGIELEVNQSFVAQGGTPWVRLRSDLIDALAKARTAALKQAPP